MGSYSEARIEELHQLLNKKHPEERVRVALNDYMRLLKNHLGGNVILNKHLLVATFEDVRAIPGDRTGLQAITHVSGDPFVRLSVVLTEDYNVYTEFLRLEYSLTGSAFVYDHFDVDDQLRSKIHCFVDTEKLRLFILNITSKKALLEHRFVPPDVILEERKSRKART